jgi:hypothetical protein
MKPWDPDFAEQVENEDAEEKAWAETKANEYYFSVMDEGDGPQIMVSPIEYFDKEGYCYDQHMPIDHLLPPDEFECLCEATWGADPNLSVEEVENRLLELGFVKNKKFDEFVGGDELADEDDDFEDDDDFTSLDDDEEEEDDEFFDDESEDED